MKNEILEELWKAKDELCEEYGNDVETLAKALMKKENNQTNRIVDLSLDKKDAA